MMNFLSSMLRDEVCTTVEPEYKNLLLKAKISSRKKHSGLKSRFQNKEF